MHTFIILRHCYRIEHRRTFHLKCNFDTHKKPKLSSINNTFIWVRRRCSRDCRIAIRYAHEFNYLMKIYWLRNRTKITNNLQNGNFFLFFLVCLPISDLNQLYGVEESSLAICFLCQNAQQSGHCVAIEFYSFELKIAFHCNLQMHGTSVFLQFIQSKECIETWFNLHNTTMTVHKMIVF